MPTLFEYEIIFKLASRGWAKERLSAYKVPHRIRFTQALPVGPSGKVLKRAIDIDAFLEPEIVAGNS